MKNFILVIWTLFLGSAQATVPPTNQEAAYINPTVVTNVLTNPSFERGLIGVTEDANISTLETTNIIDGIYSLKMDSTGASQHVQIGKTTQGRLTYNASLAAIKSCTIHFAYYAPSAISSSITAVAKRSADDVQVGSTYTLTGSASTWNMADITFPCPTSAPYLEFTFGGNESAIYVDQILVGTTLLMQVAQAQFAGASHIATTAACTPTRTNTALGAFSTDTDCPGPTIDFQNIGSWQTTDADLPQQTINNLPPGNYMMIATVTAQNGSNQTFDFALNDGVTTSSSVGADGLSGARSEVVIVGNFNYTTAGNHTFAVYASASTGSIIIDQVNGHHQIVFNLYYYPTTTNLAVNPGTTPASWSGYHDNDCSWTTTSTSFVTPSADASCTFTQRQNTNFGTVSSTGSKTPGITFNPPRIGKYWVCANGNYNNNTTNVFVYGSLTDGTTEIARGELRAGTGSQYATIPVCGIWNATSLAAASLTLQMAVSANTGQIGDGSTQARSIEWTIFELDAPMPTPFLQNSVTTNSSGGLRIEEAQVTISNSAAAVVSQSGTWLSVANGASAGLTTGTITGFSSAPACTCTVIGAATTSATHCIFTAEPTTSTLLFSRNRAGAAENGDVNVICVGNR